MTLLQIINAIVVVVGVPTIVKVLLNIGGKLKTLETLDDDIKNIIKPDLKDIRERFFALEGKSSSFFQTASPVQLLGKGEEALEKSGFKKYIDDNKSSLFKDCDPKKETTAYEVQEHIFRLFDEMIFDEENDKKFKEYAYQQGIAMTLLRRVGAIYFRNICLDKFKMKPDDIDKQVPQTIKDEQK